MRWNKEGELSREKSPSARGSGEGVLGGGREGAGPTLFPQLQQTRERESGLTFLPESRAAPSKPLPVSLLTELRAYSQAA